MLGDLKRTLQESLFELPPRVAPAEPRVEYAEIAERLPPTVRLGTMSWAFEGWRGIVYSSTSEAKRLSHEGLPAYSAHPLLRAVEIDRSFYEPLPAAAFTHFASQVPPDFRFVVKAHEETTLLRFPDHARYGKKRGTSNSRFLEASYATDQVVGPASEGLGEKLGTLLFQFPPQSLGEPRRFADALESFFAGLPRGIPYTVEIRNAELLTAAYGAALARSGVMHCHNVWGPMPDVREQARQLPRDVRQRLIVRWLLRPGDTYEGARSRFLPFNRLVEEDGTTRASIVELVARAVSFDVPTLVLVNNKAEGSAPLSLFRIAEALVARSPQN
ncbi:MAG TPA: DUF72 domain-containing protein [Polyangiaceae bacterium]|nr:DUF72 domain-containing protein [Polyangiaceae bacterium]